MLAASLRALVEVKGVPQASAKLRDFQTKLKEVSTGSATADLQAKLESRGFDEYAAKIDEAKAKSVRPITQTVKVDYKSAPAQAAIRDMERLKRVWGGNSGNGGLGKGLGEALTPFGGKASAIAALSPVLLGVAGGLTAIAGSAAEAAAGVGALGIAAGGVAAVGLAGVASVAIPAVSGLKELTKAQDACTTAVKLYGGHSKEAATALAKLHLAEQDAAPAALGLVKSLSQVKEKWSDLTKPGQNDFIGIAKDAVTRFQQLMPQFAASANSSMAAVREGFDAFQKQVTGPGFSHFIETMTGTFARIVPVISHGLADWAQIFMRIANAAAPSLEKVVHLWSHWSDELLKSTGDSKSLEGTIEKLVGQTLAWVHLLGSAGNLLVAVFSSGASEGKRLVEDLTGKFEEWTRWIETHRTQVHEFFHRAAEMLRNLTTIFGGFLPQWVVFSEAMRPIASALLAITNALNSIKIGNISALTALLGAFIAARGIGKIAGAIDGISALGGLAGGRAAAAGGAAASAGEFGERQALRDAGLIGGGGAGAGLGSRALSALPRILGTAGGLGASAGLSVAGALLVNPDGGLLNPASTASAKIELDAIQKSKGLDFHGSKAQLASLTKAFDSTMEKLRASAALGIGGIDKALETGLMQADALFIKGTQPWRRHTAEAMEAAVGEIRKGMKAGTIPAEEGQKEISHLLGEIKLVKGTDPFGLAKATAQTFKETGSITAGGIADWVKKLEVMPKAAREKSEDATNAMLRAWAQGHPKLEAQIANLTDYEKQKFGATNRQLEGSTAKMASNLAESAGDAAHGVGAAVQNIFDNLSSALAAVGAAKHPHFSLQILGAASQYHHQREQSSGLGRQRGGHIDVGAPSGDSVPAMLEKGEYVLNRNAVAAVGTRNLDALNYGAASRFQKGGQAGRLTEPHLVGPGAVQSVGQASIHDAYKAAQHYLGQHTPHGGGNVAVPGGGGAVIAQIARVLFANGFNKIAAAGIIGNAYRESTWNPGAVGTGGGGLWGFTSGAISLAALQGAASRAQVPWTDVPFQTGFMLRHGGMGLRGALNSAGDAGSAARIFMEQWERPGIPAQGEREAAARKALAMGYQRGGAVDPRAHRSPAAKRAYLAQKWAKARTKGLGGLVGAAEQELGVPQSKHHAHEHATASDAVHWAMRHLGQTNDYGYPGEWCGAFLAADMKAIGLPVPSGYPSAVNWATYGTPLGKGHIQAGAILDYGSSHVAMAVSASEQIQGNDMHGAVGTSGIGGTIGGSPITAVRWPPYGTGPGAGSTPTEKVPGEWRGAHTHALSFPSTPGNLHGIEGEIRRWTKELHRYEAAAKTAPNTATQHAIQANITRINKYLNELQRARHKARAEAAKKHFTKKLARILGITGQEHKIELAQRAYAIANQMAEQVVGLEPQEPILPPNATEAQQLDAQKHYAADFESYVNTKEAPAYQTVLAKEAEWRNLILGTETKVSGLEENWELDIRGKDAEIAAIPKHAAEVKKQVQTWKKQHPHAKHLPDILGREYQDSLDELQKLPMLRFEDSALRKTLGEARGEFYGGTNPRWKPVQPPMAPLVGSGGLETSLQDVQGIHWPDQHESLGAAALGPPRQAGRFGGAIWETQSAIEELGLKITQAQANIAGAGAGAGGAASAGKTEREELLETLLRQDRERELVAQVGQKTISGFPYAGAYAKGGIVSALVGEQGPEIATFPTGTRITPAGETKQMLSPNLTIEELHVHEDGSVTMKYDGHEFEAAVGKVVRKTTGVGRATPGGARV